MGRLKWPKNTKIRQPKVAAAAEFAGSIRARPAGLAVKFYCQDRPVVVLLSIRCVYSSGGQNRLPRLKLDRPKNGLKRSNSRFSGFGDFLSGFGVGS